MTRAQSEQAIGAAVKGVARQIAQLTRERDEARRELRALELENERLLERVRELESQLADPEALLAHLTAAGEELRRSGTDGSYFTEWNGKFDWAQTAALRVLMQVLGGPRRAGKGWAMRYALGVLESGREADVFAFTAISDAIRDAYAQGATGAHSVRQRGVRKCSNAPPTLRDPGLSPATSDRPTHPAGPARDSAPCRGRRDVYSGG